MMFVRRPLTHSLFEPAIASPHIACWVLPADSEKEDEKTAVSSNKSQDKSTSEPTTKDKPATNKSWRFLLDDFEIFEEEGNFALSTDLPGVKQADLKVEFHNGTLQVEGTRKRGTKKQSFIRRLAMDEDVVDVENLKGTLEDGILTVKAPKTKKTEKKEREDHKVVVSKAYPPEGPIVPELNMEIDMPGVKADALEVVLSKKGVLNVVGERHNKSPPQSANNKRSVAYRLNTRNVDTSKLEAYFKDGVLTIRAPAKIHKTKIVPVNGQLPPPPTPDDKHEAKVEEEKKKKGE